MRKSLAAVISVAGISGLAFGVTLAMPASGAGAVVTPKITKVAFTGTVAKPTVTVTGSGFGASHPSPTYPPGGCPNHGTGRLFGNNFDFHDDSGPWTAGQGGVPAGQANCIGIIIRSWSSTKIVFTFGNDYGPPVWQVRSGNSRCGPRLREPAQGEGSLHLDGPPEK